MGRTANSSATVYFRVDQRGDVPLYHQIYNGVREAILAGSLVAGNRLPSTRALADELGVSRTTVVSALDRLRAEGCLVSAGAAGTFVAPTSPDRRGAHPAKRPGGAGGPSRRGASLADLPNSPLRLSGTPRPFRIGTPALDLFPITTWTRLATRRLRRASATTLDYHAPGGYRPLREAIAAEVASARGIRCTADQVIIVAGARHGLAHAVRMLLDPGDAAWLEEPSLLGAHGALMAAGATVVPVPIDREGIDVAEGVRLAASARVAVVTPAHQHLLGGSLTLPRRLALLQWATAHQAWVIEDDYAGLFRSAGRPMAALYALDTEGCVIYVGSFSEVMFPALRLGFLVVPDSVIDAFVGTRTTSGQHPPTLDQAVLADFITGGHFARHRRRMREVYAERGAAMRHAITQLCPDELRLAAGDVGLHVTGHLASAVSDVRVAELAAQRGVEVEPLSPHFVGTANRRHGLVLGFAAVDARRTMSGLRILADIIRSAT